MFDRNTPLRRKELSNGTESYPVGIFLVDYAAQHATAELVAILLQESGRVWESMGTGCQPASQRLAAQKLGEAGGKAFASRFC